MGGCYVQVVGVCLSQELRVMIFTRYFFVGALFLFCSLLRQRTHFLLALLALELTSLVLIGGAIVAVRESIGSGEGLIFLLLTVSACEASLGLAILVLMVRTYGNDLITSLSLHH